MTLTLVSITLSFIAAAISTTSLQSRSSTTPKRLAASRSDYNFIRRNGLPGLLLPLQYYAVTPPLETLSANPDPFASFVRLVCRGVKLQQMLRTVEKGDKRRTYMLAPRTHRTYDKQLVRNEVNYAKRFGSYPKTRHYATKFESPAKMLNYATSFGLFTTTQN